MAAQRLEFASPGWVAAVRGLVAELASDRDLAAICYTVSEEFTHPPAHLRRSGVDTIGWHLRVHAGDIVVGDHPIDDADLRAVADYQVHRALSRRTWSDDGAAIAAAGQARREADAAGTLRTIGDLSSAPPAIIGLVRDLHDPVAAITA